MPVDNAVTHGRDGFAEGCRCGECAAEEHAFVVHRWKHFKMPHIAPQNVSWMEESECAGRDDLAFAEDWDSATAYPLAKKFCGNCSVRSECLRFGVATGSGGIWGGHFLPWDGRGKVVDLL